ncbi:MAG TPA: DUF3471 domain-containing protein [Phnomibacter sp.]|nr:DUF3471 domain-containing protein [Phnomibacter sp.]
MKKSLLLVLAIILTTVAVNAQQDSTLAQYTGKYIFPTGSPVSDCSITVSDSNLVVSSAMGNATLVKIEGDKFNVSEYNGYAEFRRNEAGKVTAFYIKVGDLELVGNKEAAAIYWMRPLQLFKM